MKAKKFFVAFIALLVFASASFASTTEYELSAPSNTTAIDYTEGAYTKLGDLLVTASEDFEAEASVDVKIIYDGKMTNASDSSQTISYKLVKGTADSYTEIASETVFRFTADLIDKKSGITLGIVITSNPYAAKDGNYTSSIKFETGDSSGVPVLGETFVFGKYNNKELEWETLYVSNETRRAILYTKDIVATKAWGKSSTYDNKWSTSYVKEWLNGEFLKAAFTDDEKSKLLKVSIPDDYTNYSGHDTYSKTQILNENGDDLVFLLSKSDIALSQFSSAPKSEYVIGDNWFLRTQYYLSGSTDGQKIYLVYSSSAGDNAGKFGACDVNNQTALGIRPAIWLDFSGMIAGGKTTISFQKEIYTLSYDLAGGSLSGDTSNPTSFDVYSKAFTLTNPTKTGYKFAGWTGTSLDVAATTVKIEKGSKGDRTYTATWTPIIYSMDYYALYEWGTLSNDNPKTYTIESTDFTLNNPTRKGYIFSGWSGDVKAEQSKDVTISKGSIGNRKYTAEWTSIIYPISYVLNDGSTSGSNPNTYTIEDSFTLSNPTKRGYDFSGWTGTDLSGASTNVTISKGSIGSRDYTANWTQIVYSITYELNNGTLSSNNPENYTIETGTFTLNNPTRDGYQFDGWTGTDLSEKTQSVTVSQNSIGDRSYTANFTPIEYVITYELNGGENSSANPAGYTIEDATITLAAPTKTGYDFAGWTLNGEAITEIPARSIGDRTLTATWTLINYVITYELDGGENSSGNPTDYTIEGDTITLGTPTKEGYDFLGWTADGESVTEISAGSVSDKVLVATWRETAPTISQTEYTLTVQENQQAELTITATGVNLSWNISGALPDGLTFSSSENSAAITGTPEAGTAGDYPVTITAGNEGGSVSANVSITVESSSAPDPDPEDPSGPTDPTDPDEPVTHVEPEQEDAQEEGSTETQEQTFTTTTYDIDESLKIDSEEAVNTASKTLVEAAADMGLTEEDAQNIEENTNAGVSETFGGDDGEEVNIVSGSSEGVTITQSENNTDNTSSTSSSESNNGSVALGGFQVETGSASAMGGTSGIINTPLPRQNEDLWGLAVNGTFTATNTSPVQNNNAMPFSAAAISAADDENNSGVVFFDSNGNVTTIIPTEEDNDGNARIGGFMSMAARVEPNTTYDFVLSVPVEELKAANIEVTETPVEVTLTKFTYYSTPYFTTLVSPDYILGTEYYRVSDDSFADKINHVKIGREAWTRTDAELALATKNNYTLITKLRSFDATPENNSHRYIVAITFSSDKIAQIDKDRTGFIFFPNGPANNSADASNFEVLKYDTEAGKFVTFTPSEITQNGTAYLAFDLDGKEIFDKPMLAASTIVPAAAEKFAISITKEKITVAQGDEESAELSAENESGEVKYSFSDGTPKWVKRNNNIVTFAPSVEDATGDYKIKITGTDDENHTASVDVVVTVTDGSVNPVSGFKIGLSAPELNLKVGQPDSVKITSNALGKASYEINAPKGAGAALAENIITVSPTAAGNYDVVISGSDDGRKTDNTDEATLKVKATPANSTVGSSGGGCSAGLGAFTLAVVGIFIARGKK